MSKLANAILEWSKLIHRSVMESKETDDSLSTEAEAKLVEAQNLIVEELMKDSDISKMVAFACIEKALNEKGNIPPGLMTESDALKMAHLMLKYGFQARGTMTTLAKSFNN